MFGWITEEEEEVERQVGLGRIPKEVADNISWCQVGYSIGCILYTCALESGCVRFMFPHDTESMHAITSSLQFLQIILNSLVPRHSLSCFPHAVLNFALVQ